MGGFIGKDAVRETKFDESWPQYMKMDANSSMKEPIQAKIEGEVPKWLAGVLYRNGPGIYTIGDTTWNHFFDGLAVLHKWTIQDGGVSFMGTVLDSDDYQKCVKANRLLGLSFGSNFPDPCKSFFRKYFSYFLPLPPDITDNTAVNIVEIGDKLFALTESTICNEIDPESLRPKGKVNLASTLAVHIATAHPHSEKDGTTYFYGTNMDYRKSYNIIQVPPASNGEDPFSNAKIIGSVPSSRKLDIGYMHSFGVTDNYCVLFELPLAMNIVKLMTLSMSNSAITDAMNTFPEEPIRIHLIEKKTGNRVPIQYEGPEGGMVFHFINCYEKNGQVICDVVLIKSGEVVKNFYLNNMFTKKDKDVDAAYARFVLPLEIKDHGKNCIKFPDTTATATLKEGTDSTFIVTPEYIDGSPSFELPRINYDYNATNYQYVYGISTNQHQDINHTLVKLDVKNKTWKEYTIERTHTAGEPVFVPSPNAKSEDDGVILSPVVAVSPGSSSFLLILDASSFKEIARATVPAELTVSFSFHGSFTSKLR